MIFKPRNESLESGLRCDLVDAAKQIKEIERELDILKQRMLEKQRCLDSANDRRDFLALTLSLIKKEDVTAALPRADIPF